MTESKDKLNKANINFKKENRKISEANLNLQKARAEEQLAKKHLEELLVYFLNNLPKENTEKW